MTATNPDDEPESRTESLDSMLVEFTDADLTLVSPDPEMVEEAVRRATGRPGEPASTDPAEIALAECLLEQAMVFKMLKRFAEAVSPITEAMGLFERAGRYRRVADCFHVAAEIHRGLGEVEKALEYLRKEEDIRRRLAA
jgi:hypothetical protein